MYEIETDVPIPDGQYLSTKYPFHEMVTGDSFFVPFMNDHEEAVRNRVHSAVAQHRRRHGGRFMCRTMNAPRRGLRVWRLEDEDDG